MSAATVTEAEFRTEVANLFKALDLDRNDSLDWNECREMVAAVMKQDGGYDANSFKAKYDAMDKNADGKISKAELMESVVQVGRERKLFGEKPVGKQHAGRDTVKFGVLDDPNEPAVDVQVFREGLSCLGKTFNNARHAYLKMNICDKALTTLKVSVVIKGVLTEDFAREWDVTSTCSTSMSPTTR